MKLLIPPPGGTSADPDLSAGFRAGFLAIPEEERGWMRTYTVRSAGLVRLDGRQVPSLTVDVVLHGDADHVVASSNAQSAAMVWASATASRPSAERLVRRGQRHPMRVTDFKRGRRVHVTLCEIERLGHAWSGGLKSVAYSDPAGPDATRLVWAFAEKQFKAVA